MRDERIRAELVFDRLPVAQHDEAALVLKIIFDEFSSILSTATSGWKKAARIQKILVWSDTSEWTERAVIDNYAPWHLLIVLNTERLTSFAKYWAAIQEKLRCETFIHSRLSREAHILVDTLANVNRELLRGTPFFVEIVRSAATLYDDGSSELARPRSLTDTEVSSAARKHFEFWFPHSSNAVALAHYSLEVGAFRDAAFMLHAAAERAYYCILLRLRLYYPKTHNLRLLRSISEGVAPALKAAWPRESRFEIRCFELLRRSYVKARYREEFTITREELTWISKCVRDLRKLVQIESAIQDLPIPVREVFNARRVEALEYEQIAKRFGLAETDVESKIHLALDTLATSIA